MVEDLQTKVVKKADFSKPRQHAAAGEAAGEAATGAPAAEAADDSYPCSYEMEWQVKEAGGQQQDSRHAGKLSLLVRDTPAAAGSISEHLVLQLRTSDRSQLAPAEAAASTLAVLQQVNQTQPAHAAAGSGKQLSIAAGIALAGSSLGPANGLQGATGTRADADAASAMWGLLRTEATEQTAISVSLQALDGSAAPQLAAAFGQSGAAAAGALHATAVKGAAVEVPRLLPCTMPEEAEYITIRPEPRSALSNLVARVADISQVRLSFCVIAFSCMSLLPACHVVSTKRLRLTCRQLRGIPAQVVLVTMCPCKPHRCVVCQQRQACDVPVTPAVCADATRDQGGVACCEGGGHQLQGRA